MLAECLAHDAFYAVAVDRLFVQALADGKANLPRGTIPGFGPVHYGPYWIYKNRFALFEQDFNRNGALEALLFFNAHVGAGNIRYAKITLHNDMEHIVLY